MSSWTRILGVAVGTGLGSVAGGIVGPVVGPVAGGVLGQFLGISTTRLSPLSYRAVCRRWSRPWIKMNCSTLENC
jgi:hypothetical protein